MVPLVGKPTFCHFRKSGIEMDGVQKVAWQKVIIYVGTFATAILSIFKHQGTFCKVATLSIFKNQGLK